MAERRIRIVESAEGRYRLEANFRELGRMWDNEAESVVVERPAGEAGSACTMIVSSCGVVVDHVAVGDDPVWIRSNVSAHRTVDVGFSFTRADGYVKNTEVRRFEFLDAQKPDGFVPAEPEQSGNINAVIGLAFTDVVKKDGVDGTYEFKNILGETVKEIQFEGVGAGGGIAEEVDPTVPEFVKNITEDDISNWNNKSEFGGSYNDLINKPTIPTKVSELDNDENYATQGYVDQKVADLVNSAPETLDTLGEVAQAIKENEDVVEALNNAIGNKADKSSVPTFTATQLEDGSYSLTITEA